MSVMFFMWRLTQKLKLLMSMELVSNILSCEQSTRLKHAVIFCLSWSESWNRTSAEGSSLIYLWAAHGSNRKWTRRICRRRWFTDNSVLSATRLFCSFQPERLRVSACPHPVFFCSGSSWEEAPLLYKLVVEATPSPVISHNPPDLRWTPAPCYRGVSERLTDGWML